MNAGFMTKSKSNSLLTAGRDSTSCESHVITHDRAKKGKPDSLRVCVQHQEVSCWWQSIGEDWDWD